VWKDKNGKVVKKHPNYGQRYTARKKFLKGLCKKAGVKEISFHALRRFFASLLADKHKESMPTIQKLLGHASVNTTERYVQRIHGDTRAAVAKIKFEIPISTQISTQKEKGAGNDA